MLPPETSAGAVKKLKFITEAIEHSPVNLVLDFGCGTGNNITVPLADYFPNIKFVGVDSDIASIEFAQNNNSRANLTFAHPQDIDSYGKFDFIIASEVIEHVKNPEELLFFLKEKVGDGGKIILTLPNGYGPSELMSLLETLLQLSGIYALIRYVKQTLIGRSAPVSTINIVTLAISPHLNFFSYNEIKKLIAKVGFNVVQYRSRTWLCGFVFTQIMLGQPILKLNAKIADYLSPYLVSGWMFLLSKEESMQSVSYCYTRNYFTRLRKYLNEKRWKVIKN